VGGLGLGVRLCMYTYVGKYMFVYEIFYVVPASSVYFVLTKPAGA